MKKSFYTICFLLFGLSLVASASESMLRTNYTRQMEALKAELLREIPTPNEAKKTAYNNALKQEEAAD